MSATTDQMTTALTNIETAVVALGSAYASYEAGRQTTKSARATARGIDRAEDIDNVISSSQLAAVIAARLHALGLAPVLAHSPAEAGTQSAAWVDVWAAKVTAIVP